MTEPKIELLNIDCLLYMKQCEDNQFDLAIVDPPYGIGESGGKIRTNKKRPCYELRKKETKYTPKDWDNNRPKKEYWQELFRVSKNQIVWGGNYFVEHLPVSMGWIFWDKKNEGTVFSDGEMAFTSFKRGLKMYRLSSKHGTRGGIDRIHPTEKPKKLYDWVLMNYAKEGDKIIDTHLGSGNIALACYDQKFDLVGIEIDKEYFNNANNSLKVHKQQLTLF
ncbi:MAG: site-specific DNA-methyltransferase [Delftia sp.]|nr:site-specific DNA-methyltransferase [Delftia sp.]